MARVSLIGETDHPELADTIAKIKGARGGRLINVYRLMLHSPTLADAWFEFTSVDVQRAHGPSYALKEGLTPEQVAAIADWQRSKLFNDKQRTLLAYTDAMTRQIDVADGLFTEVRKYFSERQTVELTMLIGTYNMFTRVLQALKIDPEPA